MNGYLVTVTGENGEPETVIVYTHDVISAACAGLRVVNPYANVTAVVSVTPEIEET